MTESAWRSIHAVRRALAQDLADLTSAQCSTPSRCAGWTVHQVLAHQLATAKMTSGSFLTKFAGADETCPLFPRTTYEDWTPEDPKGKDLEAVRRVVGEIDARVGDLLIRLRAASG